MTRCGKLISTISPLVYIFSCFSLTYSKEIQEEQLQTSGIQLDLNENKNLKNEYANKLMLGVPVFFLSTFIAWNIKKRIFAKNDKKFWKKIDGIKLYLSNLKHWEDLIDKYIILKKYNEKCKDAIYEVLRECGVLGLASEEMTDEGRLIAIKAVDVAISYIKSNERKNSSDYITMFNNSLDINEIYSIPRQILSDQEKKLCDVTFENTIHYDCFLNKNGNITISAKCEGRYLNYLYEIDLTRGGSNGDYKTPHISLYIYNTENLKTIESILVVARTGGRQSDFAEAREPEYSFRVLSDSERNGLKYSGN